MDMSQNLETILSTLEYKSVDKEDSLTAYDQFIKNLKEDGVSLFMLDVTKNISRIIAVIQRDISSDAEEISQNSLQVLGYCLYDKDIVGNINAQSAESLVKGLCDRVRETKDKTTCTRALWCLAQQQLPVDVISKQVPQIIDCVCAASEKWLKNSVTVENEIVSVIARLLEQCSQPLLSTELVTQWFKAVCPLLGHNAVKIHEKVYMLLDKASSGLLGHPDVASTIVSDFKSTLQQDLNKMFQSKHEMFVMKAWALLVKLLGTELHRGAFINQVLPVAELGFKSSSPEVKCAAFVTWQALIDNFAIDNAILSDPKRVKLIMQVFRINNAKLEVIAEQKLRTWWYFVRRLSSKLPIIFDQVCVPLIHFCIGGSKVTSLATPPTPTISRHAGLSCGSGGVSSPITPRMSLISTPSSHLPTFPSVQLKGCEILAMLLGSSQDDSEEVMPDYLFSLDVLSSSVVTGPSFFIKQGPFLILSAKDLICSLGDLIEDSLVYHIWYSLVAHMKNALESGLKVDCRDVMTVFMSSFQLLILSQTLKEAVVLRLFESVCCLPRKALSSTMYQIGEGEILHGTPSLFLLEVLLTPWLMGQAHTSESYKAVYTKLLDIGLTNPVSTLEFCQSVVQLLDNSACCSIYVDLHSGMWISLVEHLISHARKSNEVNQGDALEYNFTCMYNTLMFPIMHLFDKHISQTTRKSLHRMWSELYGTFARLSAMVANAEANSCSEELSTKIENAITESQLKNASFLDSLIQICKIQLDNVNFSAVGQTSSFYVANPLSPSKWAKRRHKPLGALTPLVSLIAKATGKLVAVATKHGPTEEWKHKDTPYYSALQSSANEIVTVLSMLFNHITTSQAVQQIIVKLAQPVASLFSEAGKRVAVPVFSKPYLPKLEKLWLDISTCIQSRFSGPYDSDFLAEISPMLEAVFLHSKRQIRNQTLVLWGATFSRSVTLIYPENLRPVLTTVKEKTPLLQLPGWITSDLPVIEETPYSQMSQIGGDAPEPHLPGMPSPRKLHGSFLNKAVSPNIKRSPASKQQENQAAKSPSFRKNIFSFSELSNTDFVYIAPSPKQKRVLTEHQKDVLMEKSVLPTMYNTLDQSQDVGMMSQFITDTQIDSGQNSIDVIEVLKAEKEKNLFKTPSDADPEKPVKNLKLSTDTNDSTVKEKKLRRRSVRFEEDVKDPETSSTKSTDTGKILPESTLTEVVLDSEPSEEISQTNDSDVIPAGLSERNKAPQEAALKRGRSRRSISSNLDSNSSVAGEPSTSSNQTKDVVIKESSEPVNRKRGRPRKSVVVESSLEAAVDKELKSDSSEMMNRKTETKSTTDKPVENPSDIRKWMNRTLDKENSNSSDAKMNSQASECAEEAMDIGMEYDSEKSDIIPIKSPRKGGILVKSPRKDGIMVNDADEITSLTDHREKTRTRSRRSIMKKDKDVDVVVIESQEVIAPVVVTSMKSQTDDDNKTEISRQVKSSPNKNISFFQAITENVSPPRCDSHVDSVFIVEDSQCPTEFSEFQKPVISPVASIDKHNASVHTIIEESQLPDSDSIFGSQGFNVSKSETNDSVSLKIGCELDVTVIDKAVDLGPSSQDGDLEAGQSFFTPLSLSDGSKNTSVNEKILYNDEHHEDIIPASPEKISTPIKLKSASISAREKKSNSQPVGDNASKRKSSRVYNRKSISQPLGVPATAKDMDIKLQTVDSKKGRHLKEHEITTATSVKSDDGLASVSLRKNVTVNSESMFSEDIQSNISACDTFSSIQMSGAVTQYIPDALCTLRNSGEPASVNCSDKSTSSTTDTSDSSCPVVKSESSTDDKTYDPDLHSTFATKKSGVRSEKRKRFTPKKYDQFVSYNDSEETDSTIKSRKKISLEEFPEISSAVNDIISDASPSELVSDNDPCHQELDAEISFKSSSDIIHDEGKQGCDLLTKDDEVIIIDTTTPETHDTPKIPAQRQSTTKVKKELAKSKIFSRETSANKARKSLSAEKPELDNKENVGKTGLCNDDPSAVVRRRKKNMKGTDTKKIDSTTKSRKHARKSTEKTLTNNDVKMLTNNDVKDSQNSNSSIVESGDVKSLAGVSDTAPKHNTLPNSEDMFSVTSEKFTGLEEKRRDISDGAESDITAGTHSALLNTTFDIEADDSQAENTSKPVIDKVESKITKEEENFDDDNDEEISTLLSSSSERKTKLAKHKMDSSQVKIIAPINTRLRSCGKGRRNQSMACKRSSPSLIPSVINKKRKRLSLQNSRRSIDRVSPGKSSDSDNMRLHASSEQSGTSKDKISPVGNTKEAPRKIHDIEHLNYIVEDIAVYNLLNKLEKAMNKKPTSPRTISVASSTPVENTNQAEIVSNKDKVTETPKSTPKSIHTAGKYCFSDSKLLVGRRKGFTFTGKRKMLKGILKSPIASREVRQSAPTTGSPVRHRSLLAGLPHSVHQPRFYSPSASPSAGILKRKRLLDVPVVNSPSPPNKHRRVSFADDVSSENNSNQQHVNRCLELAQSDRIISESSSSSVSDSISTRVGTVNRCLEMQQANPSLPLSPLAKLSMSKLANLQKKTSLSSSSSMSSTQGTDIESQLDCTAPIYPTLSDCKVLVKEILPLLTSTVWSRGLGQLLHARNIHTIGDLSRLTEYEVHNLPIRAPKVATVRNVLESFSEQHDLKRSKVVVTAPVNMECENGKENAVTNNLEASDNSNNITAPQISTDSNPTSQPTRTNTCDSVPLMSSDIPEKLTSIPEAGENRGSDPEERADSNHEAEMLPAVEDALKELSPYKATDTLDTSFDVPNQAQDVNIKDDSEHLSHLLQSGNSDNQCYDDSEKPYITASDLFKSPSMALTASTLESSGGTQKSELLKQTCELQSFTEKIAENPSTRELFEIQTKLVSLTQVVMNALKSKCQSPSSSQDIE